MNILATNTQVGQTFTDLLMKLMRTLEDIHDQLLVAIKTLDTIKTCTAFELPVLGT